MLVLEISLNMYLNVVFYGYYNAFFSKGFEFCYLHFCGGKGGGGYYIHVIETHTVATNTTLT